MTKRPRGEEVVEEEEPLFGPLLVPAADDGMRDVWAEHIRDYLASADRNGGDYFTATSLSLVSRAAHAWVTPALSRHHRHRFRWLARFTTEMLRGFESPTGVPRAEVWVEVVRRLHQLPGQALLESSLDHCLEEILHGETCSYPAIDRIHATYRVLIRCETPTFELLHRFLAVARVPPASVYTDLTATYYPILLDEPAGIEALAWLMAAREHVDFTRRVPWASMLRHVLHTASWAEEPRHPFVDLVCHAIDRNGRNLGEPHYQAFSYLLAAHGYLAESLPWPVLAWQPEGLRGELCDALVPHLEEARVGAWFHALSVSQALEVWHFTRPISVLVDYYRKHFPERLREFVLRAWLTHDHEMATRGVDAMDEPLPGVPRPTVESVTRFMQECLRHHLPQWPKVFRAVWVEVSPYPGPLGDEDHRSLDSLFENVASASRTLSESYLEAILRRLLALFPTYEPNSALYVTLGEHGNRSTFDLWRRVRADDAVVLSEQALRWLVRDGEYLPLDSPYSVFADLVASLHRPT